MKLFSLISPQTLIIISILIIIQATKGENLINTTCKTLSKNDPNINYTFCTTSLQAAAASRCATLRGLGTISVRLLSHNITNTRRHITQLMKNKKLDSYVRQCLSDCFELYSDSIPSVEKAMKYYNNKRFDDANVAISSIMDASTTCEDGFKEGRTGVNSPLSERNDDVFQLSAVALSVMRLLQTGS
ncbi:hypothetical protein ABFX02_02G137800 [Erythranthe guttata]